MANDETLTAISAPVSIEKRQEYTGDIRTMSGGTEVGYWLDRYAILDSIGGTVCDGIVKKSTAEEIANCINEHESLAKELRETKAKLAEATTLIREGMEASGTGTLHYHKMRAALAKIKQ